MSTVFVVSSKVSKVKKIEGFSGRTFGDLQGHESFQELWGNGSGLEAVVRPGNVVLRDATSILPEGDEIKVFLTPTKNEAGIDIDDITKEISEAIEDHEEGATEKLKNALLNAIQNFYKDAPVSTDQDDEAKALLEEAKNI